MNGIYAQLNALFDYVQAINEFKPIAKIANDDISYRNLLFLGPTGTGKTAIVKQWAEEHENEINFRYFDCSFLRPVKTEADGREFETLFSVDQIDCLQKANTVVCFDNVQRLVKEARPQFFAFLDERKVTDQSGGNRLLPDVLFTVSVATQSCKDDLSWLQKKN